MMEIDWDPEIEAPATIAILGGGPVGIEAAIYARFLGYFVSIFETRRVAHRMLDWHDRLLSVPVSSCTTPLGLAAIKAQDPEYVLPSPDCIWTGKQYAEEYLLPLAKTDLLFDDIHFLSPVTNVSRLRTPIHAPVTAQERCNDEFRLVVEGRHRGTWIARADIVLDCRGEEILPAGIGPGGGVAIGELSCSEAFFRHTPKDRKFENKHLASKHVCLVGTSFRACQFVEEYIEWMSSFPGSKLTWILPPVELVFSELVRQLASRVDADTTGQTQTWRLLGVEKVEQIDGGSWKLNVLMEDGATVDFQCDVLATHPEYRWAPLPGELNYGPLLMNPTGSTTTVFTQEPGYYRLPTHRVGITDGSNSVGSNNAGGELPLAFNAIRELFCSIVGRESLNLYQVMADNLAEGRV